MDLFTLCIRGRGWLLAGFPQVEESLPGTCFLPKRRGVGFASAIASKSAHLQAQSVPFAESS